MIAKLVNFRHDSFLFWVNAIDFIFGDQPCNNKLTGWFTGGINYHIEHHLFPRMNHLHLPKIQPIVREFCSERGIPYNYFPSVWGNFLSFVKHLHFLGHNDKYDNMALSPLKPSKQGALDLVLSQHQVDQIYSYDKNRWKCANFVTPIRLYTCIYPVCANFHTKFCATYILALIDCWIWRKLNIRNTNFHKNLATHTRVWWDIMMRRVVRARSRFYFGRRHEVNG